MTSKKPPPPNPSPNPTPTKKKHKKKKSKNPNPSTPKKMLSAQTDAPPPPAMTSPSSKKRKSRDHDDGGDSLTILEAVIDFQSKNRGANPTPTNMTPLYESVRDTLHVDYTQSQLYNRIRHLRQKFYGLLGSGNVGPAPADRAFFDLSLRAWGDSKKRTPTPSPNGPAAAAKTKAAEKEKAAAAEEDDGLVRDEEMEDVENGEGEDSFKYLSHQAKEYWRAAGLPAESLEMGLKSMDRAKAKLLEKKWVQHGDAGLKIQAKQSEIERDLFLALHATRKVCCLEVRSGDGSGGGSRS